MPPSQTIRRHAATVPRRPARNRIFLPPHAPEQPRGSDAPEVIESRVAKAEYELGFAPKFDTVIVNDDLETAKAEALKVISQFLNE